MADGILCILNPNSGKRANRAPDIRRVLHNSSVPIGVVETEERGHATRLAREASRLGTSKILAIGGDGTVNEVLNGIVGSEVELGIIPIGRGNDIARSLGLPLTSSEVALERALHGKPKRIDYVRAGDRYFLSMFGLGFPIDVMEEAERIRYLRGSAAFVAGVYRALARLRTIDVKLTLDDDTCEMKCTCVMIHNTPFIGGGLQMAPSARIDDGFLDVVTIGPMNRFEIMVHFPRVLWRRHLNHPAFRVRRAKEVRIEFEAMGKRLLDGDIIDTESPNAIEMEINPGALKVMT